MSYPLRFPDDDPRFTSELLDDISAVLIRHGYPWTENGDASFADLRAALAGFLYGPAFNRGDKVTWVSDSKVYSGKVEYVANGDNGPVARIDASPQPGGMCRFTTVVACRKLTLVPDGER
jgi:hypothetical protein